MKYLNLLYNSNYKIFNLLFLWFIRRWAEWERIYFRNDLFVNIEQTFNIINITYYAYLRNLSSPAYCFLPPQYNFTIIPFIKLF